jgi:hypothetical protein
VPHCFIYVWTHGVQCRGVDDRPGESCLWRDVMACPVSVQERLRGWRCRGRSFSGRPHADSRVPLTGGRTRHSSRCGNVPSPRASTALGTAMQCPGWCRDGRDGRTGPTTTEMTSPAGLTSRRNPGQAWNRRSSPSRVPPSSFEGAARQSYESGRHSVTGLTPATPHSTAQWRGWPHRGSWRNSVGA